MLYSIILQISPIEDVLMPCTQGHFVYSAILKLINNIQPELAVELHEPNAVKLFTLSQVLGNFQKQDNCLLLTAKKPYFIRMTICDEKIFGRVLSVLIDRKLDRITLGKNILKIEKIFTNKLDHCLADFVENADLWNRSSNRDRVIGLKFLSPTTFRAGKNNIILPLPELVFGSLKKKFDLVIGELSPKLSLEKSIRICRYHDLSTKVLPLRGGMQIGFVGSVYFEIKSDDLLFIKYANALAEFSKFGGVGAKTTMGFGQVIKF